MKLYINKCKNCEQKLYLNVSASSKSDLRDKLKSNEFYVVCGSCNFRNVFSVEEVMAESESNASLTGGIVGGIVGLIGGPIGAIIGGTIGAAIGNSSDEEEKKRVNFFNHSV